jgi:hypothetical protein
MMKIKIGLCVCLFLLGCSANLFAEETIARVDFAREILPILSDKCFLCHGPDAYDKDLVRLDSFAGATEDRGGYRAIDTEHPDKSELLKRIHSSEDPMPPEDAEKQLTAAEKQVMSRWLEQGGEYAMHWAFVPPQKRSPLSNAESELSKTEAIDTYILARLQEKSLGLAPRADRATLARRAALVLTGLPPEPEQLAEFLADDQEQAYERFVDQLLDSPRFGEHQARYWLDAVRYGDTHGLHLDNRRAIFPYRDWVVQAFNDNLPLNDFITWQLAGDLLPEPTLEQLVATGFVRMNPSTAEGGAIPEEFQAKNNFDRTETLGTVFLGMSLTCARCHTHKYDPISQTEYYELLAFFNSTAESSMDGNKYEYGPIAKTPSDLAAWSSWKQLIAAREKIVAEADAWIATAANIAEPELLAWKNASVPERLKLVESSASFADAPLQQQATELGKQITDAQQQFTTTLVAQDLEHPRETHLLQRGEYDLPVGEPLQPGTLNVMGSFPEGAPRNRLGLAQWLTSRDHPLVARVLVNRIWQTVFGEALVRTPEDFGLQGQQPTHPLLLDWLAVELHENGWNLKQMLRLMVTSQTFCQVSARRADIDDPENRWWARGPRFRLDAEVLRDVALWSSGLLQDETGGEGVKPYQPPGMWKALAHPGSNTKEYVRDSGTRLYHRSLYVYWKRTSPHPMMTLFDAPSRESSCVRRSRSNTSLQSLGLFNETQRIEASRMLAERLLRAGKDDAEKLELLFTLLASRQPSEIERNACLQLLQKMRQRYAHAEQDAIELLSLGEAPRDQNLNPIELAAWSQVATTVLASDIAILVY